MLSTIESVNSAVNNFIWGVPAMICIIGVGLYLSIRTVPDSGRTHGAGVEKCSFADNGGVGVKPRNYRA